MHITCQDEALKILKGGFPLIFQTDTLPAIGCLPEFSESIYSVKKREKNKALILMGSNISQVLKYVHLNAKDDFLRIAERFWPGALTIVIPISDNKFFNFVTQDNTLGIRIPNSESAQKLISKSGPLATSSANISGQSPSLTLEEVSADLPNVHLLDSQTGQKCSGQGSTIISWEGRQKWKIIRKGEIKI